MNSLQKVGVLVLASFVTSTVIAGVPKGKETENYKPLSTKNIEKSTSAKK